MDCDIFQCTSCDFDKCSFCAGGFKDGSIKIGASLSQIHESEHQTPSVLQCQLLATTGISEILENESDINDDTLNQNNSDINNSNDKINRNTSHYLSQNIVLNNISDTDSKSSSNITTSLNPSSTATTKSDHHNKNNIYHIQNKQVTKNRII